jgi:Na+/H+-dicarboxylate symporter
MHLSIKILIGLILGIVGGLIAGPTAVPWMKVWIAPIGTIFINLIKMVIVPVVLASIVAGVASIGDVKKLGRVGVKIMIFYLATTAFAVGIGLMFGTLMQPGKGLTIPAGAKAASKMAPPLQDVLVNIIPSNPFVAMQKGDMLQIIVFAIFLGIGITMVGSKAKPVEDFFNGLAEVTYKIIDMIMNFAPFGVFALMMPVVAVNGPKVLLPLASVVAAMYIASIVHAVVVYSGTVATLGGMSPVKFFKGIAPAMLVAFSTCSSGATLPVTLKCTQENLGVRKDVSSFCLPLGATVNMDGTAIYCGLAALFVAQAYGIELNAGQYMTIILTGTLASIGAAGVPGAGLIMLTLVLTSVGLPIEGVALIAGIDRVLDMARTTLNITGDAAGCVVVQNSESKS